VESPNPAKQRGKEARESKIIHLSEVFNPASFTQTPGQNPRLQQNHSAFLDQHPNVPNLTLT
jgi:hypothetical protein